MTGSPLVPRYGEASLPDFGAEAVRACRDAAFLPGCLRGSHPLVVLVIDGLGWEQLQERRSLAPTLSAMQGGAITTVAPSTTAAALSSFVLGCPPSVHGIVGYRVRVPGDHVLNVLRWKTANGDAIADVPPAEFQRRDGFGGRRGVPLVTQASFAGTGFTEAHARAGQIVGWYVPSSIPIEVGRLMREGESFVYAYYDGLDRIGHAVGFGPLYDAELRFVDRLVADVLAALPPGCALAVTADHGHVHVGREERALPKSLVAEARLLSGEGRFRWVHLRDDSKAEAVAARAAEELEGVAWVRTRHQVEAEGWLGPGPFSDEVAARLGDVAVVASAPVSFADPADGGSASLVGRHGSLTPAEMLVPLVGAVA